MSDTVLSQSPEAVPSVSPASASVLDDQVENIVTPLVAATSLTPPTSTAVVNNNSSTTKNNNNIRRLSQNNPLLRPTANNQSSPNMVVLKTSLALPSLSKSSGSRSNSPAHSPVTSEQGQKRTTSGGGAVRGGVNAVSGTASVANAGGNASAANGTGPLHMHISLPKARSKSGDGSKRSASVNVSPVKGVDGLPSPPITAVLSPTPSGNGTSLRPKLSSLLSGRHTPAAHTPISSALPSPAAAGTNHSSTTPSATGTATATRHGLSSNTGGVHGGTNSVSNSHTPVPHGHGGHAGIAINGLEASYVTKVGTSLNDGVNKVFPSPATVLAASTPAHGAALNDHALISYKGLCAPRVERARDVGNTIANELHLAMNDQYLLRSLLRSAVLKTLSIFLSRLESLIISPTSDPTVLFVPKTVKEAENPPQSQRFSFLILRSAWELKKGLIKACSAPASIEGEATPEMPKFVKDTLLPWITKLDLLANRIWNPILAAIKEEVVQTITVQGAIEAGLLQPSTSPSPGNSTLSLPSTTSGRSLSLSRSSTPTPMTSSHSTSSSTSLAVPAYLQHLSALLAATSRTFAWLSVAEIDHQNWKVAIGSSAIWKMMLLCSFRRVDDFHCGGGAAPSRRASPPPQPLHGLTPAGVPVANGATTPGAPTPPPVSVPPRRSMSAMGMGRLRGAAVYGGGKRSPSPPSGSNRDNLIAQNAAKLVAEVEMFEACIEKFVSSLALTFPTSARGSSQEGNPNAQRCFKYKDCIHCRGRFIPLEVDDSDDEDALPREAMQEAMTALSSFVVVLRFLANESAHPVPKLLKAIAAVDDISLAKEICPNFIRALDLLPPLILLQTLVARVPRYYDFRMPNELWNISWKEYQATMKGFHTGEEWVGEVGWELLKEARRVGRKLEQEHHQAVGANGQGETAAFVDDEGWLELVKQAVLELGEVDDLDEEGNTSASGVTLRSDVA